MMNDNPPPGVNYQTSFALGPRQTRFADVVTIVNIQGAPQFFLKHAIAGIPENVLGPTRELTVTVRGQNHPTETRTFAIADIGGVFRLVPA